MKRPTLFMETTAIPPEKTAGEITGLLVQSGASQILTEYNGNRQISGLRFILEVKGQKVPFALPARVEPIFKIINGRRKYSWDRTTAAAKDREQAQRVAWRQLFRWVQAQVALIDCGMVDAAEVFYPYVQVAPDMTMYQHALEHGAFSGKMLGPAPDPPLTRG